MISHHWNSEEIRVLFPNAQNLGEVIVLLSKTVEENGEVICEIRVNDFLLNESDEDRFKSTPVSEIQQVDVKASTPTALLQDSLYDCREYLDRLITAYEKTSELFRKENLNKAHEFYRSCINGSDWFVQLLTHYKIVHQSVYGSLPGDWLDREVRLMEVLNEVLATYEKKDFILLADLLEYEMTTVLQDWRRTLTELGVQHQNGNQQTQSPVR